MKREKHKSRLLEAVHGTARGLHELGFIDKRTKEREPTEIILTDPDFTNSLLDTLAEIRLGKMKWHGYDEVFLKSH